MLLRTTRRSGATLVEVLVAIFVMAIGLLALLALFPLGVIRMAQAIQDGRTAQSAHNAREIAVLKDIRHDSYFLAALLDKPTGVTEDVDPEGPSYPIIIDPIGSRTTLAASPEWLANNPASNVQRISASFVENQPTATDAKKAALRWFTLLDDLNFDLDGTAAKASTSIVEREINYSWIYLCQRPRSADPSVVNLSAVVFKNRSVSLDDSTSLPEQLYSVTFDTSTNTVTFDFTTDAPPLRPGDWILDCSTVYINVKADQTRSESISAPVPLGGTDLAQYRTAHGSFYRVVAVDQITDTQIQVEVETPLRGFPASTTTQGQVLILDDVVEVFDDGPGRRP